MPDVFEVRALLEIYERSLGHPNLKGLREWALYRLQAENDHLTDGSGSIAQKEVGQAQQAVELELAPEPEEAHDGS